ncbi:extensin-like [Penaeus japonicus]|uniref:extensin-like n=1 Tax=Penaeus japonicus TaxID=27405 RepID=UPI001C70CE5E|nr:extensin-like [Penaeus japonicus]
MQDSDHFLRAAFQLGPWRVTRRVLLFISVFCVVIMVFGAIVLKTHMFDEDEDFDWDDDDDEEWEGWDELSGGDAVMLVIIGLAGVTTLVACGGCFMATSNSPQQLTSDSGSIFTLSGAVPPAAPGGATLPRAAPPPSRHPRSNRRSAPTEAKLVSGQSLGPSYPHNPNFPPSASLQQQRSSYPQNPSFMAPGYPAHPPPSYSAPSYPPGGHVQGGQAPATLADLPPPYTPGHVGQQRR